MAIGGSIGNMQHKLLNCAWGSSEDLERTQSRDLGIRPMKPAARFEIATPTFQLAGEVLVCETRTTYLKTACGVETTLLRSYHDHRYM